MSRPKCKAAVELGRMRKGVMERKTPTKKAAVRANLVLAREALAEKRAAAKADQFPEIELSAIRGPVPPIEAKIFTIQ